MNSSIKPQARSNELVISQLPDELLVYDLTAHKAYCLNRPAATVWNLCDGDHTVSELTDKSAKALNTSLDEEVVLLTLAELEKFGLLQTAVKRAAGENLITRRELTRRLGIAAVMAFPVITAVIAPTAAQAASLQSEGASCSLSGECASGCCDPVAGQCASVEVCDTGARSITIKRTNSENGGAVNR